MTIIIHRDRRRNLDAHMLIVNGVYCNIAFASRESLLYCLEALWNG